MTKAWNELVRLAGSREAASALVDIWNVHNYILSEDPNGWGTGVPRGMELNRGYNRNDLEIFDNVPQQTLSMTRFSQRIVRMRQWMASIGEGSKPLWISEYGHLPPTGTTAPSSPYTEEQTRNYMTSTFDYLLSARDTNLGYAPDNYRLVQRWFWYSLSHYTNTEGGALYDQTTLQMTALGETFRDYNPSPENADLVNPDLYIKSNTIQVAPVAYNSTNRSNVDYVFTLQAGNAINSDRYTQATVKVYLNDQLIGQGNGSTMRCAGTGSLTVRAENIAPNVQHTVRLVVEPEAGYGSEVNSADNEVSYTFTAKQPNYVFVPGFFR